MQQPSQALSPLCLSITTHLTHTHTDGLAHTPSSLGVCLCVWVTEAFVESKNNADGGYSGIRLWRRTSLLKLKRTVEGRKPNQINRRSSPHKMFDRILGDIKGGFGCCCCRFLTFFLPGLSGVVGLVLRRWFGHVVPLRIRRFRRWQRQGSFGFKVRHSDFGGRPRRFTAGKRDTKEKIKNRLDNNI